MTEVLHLLRASPFFFDVSLPELEAMARGSELRRFAAEALAVHHEHRERDLEGARELALLALEEADGASFHVKAEATRHRLSRLDRKLAQKKNSHLFGGCI